MNEVTSVTRDIPNQTNTPKPSRYCCSMLSWRLKLWSSTGSEQRTDSSPQIDTGPQQRPNSSSETYQQDESGTGTGHISSFWRSMQGYMTLRSSQIESSPAEGIPPDTRTSNPQPPDARTPLLSQDVPRSPTSDTSSASTMSPTWRPLGEAWDRHWRPGRRN